MKKIIGYAVILILLIGAVIFSFKLPRRDLQATGQVAGIALDEENEKIKATFELYSPAVDEPIGSKQKTVVSFGFDIQECIDNAMLLHGESLFVDDASVLIIGGNDQDFLLPKVFEYFKLLKNDHMDLPVFFTAEQEAGNVFLGAGTVVSSQLAESGKKLKKSQTVRDLMNRTGENVLIIGEGSYEIIS